MRRATTSLPVPLSPVMRMLALEGAACRRRKKTSCIAGLEPMSLAEHAPAAQLPLEPFLVFRKAVVSDGAVKQNTKCARPDGLLHKPEGAVLVDGGESGIDAAKGGEDNDGGSASNLVQPAQQLHSVHARHHDVGDDRMGSEQREFVESLLAVGGGLDDEPQRSTIRETADRWLASSSTISTRLRRSESTGSLNYQASRSYPVREGRKTPAAPMISQKLPQ